MKVWNEGHSRRNTAMHERPEVKMRLVCLRTVRNSVELEHKAFVFVGQTGESGATGKKGREKRSWIFINEKLKSLAITP